jgi:hypothetical protein
LLEEGIPALHKEDLTLFNLALNPPQLLITEPVRILQSDRVEPELGQAIIALDMDMGRLVPNTGIKEEAVRPDAKHGWHERLPELLNRPSIREPVGPAELVDDLGVGRDAEGVEESGGEVGGGDRAVGGFGGVAV